MKRRDLLKATGAAVAALALRAVAQDSPGGVEYDLCTVDANGNPTVTVVGLVILKTNPGGQLIVAVDLDQGDDLTIFDVRVTINGLWRGEDVGKLITNDEGKGSAHLTLPIAKYPKDALEPDVLQVVVDLGGLV